MSINILYTVYKYTNNIWYLKYSKIKNVLKLPMCQ